MRRRDVIRRIGAAGAVATGAAGTSVAADDDLYVNWQWADGTFEAIPVAVFERRPDTPSLSELDLTAASSPPCCTEYDIVDFCTEC